MNQALEAIGQEPWGKMPWEIALLTDFQILEFYLKPAAKRADELRRQSSPDGPLPVPNPNAASEPVNRPHDPNVPPNKQAIIGIYRMCGVSQEDAVKQYELQLAEWRASQGVHP